MAIRVALSHRTTYRFDRHVKVSPHEIRLRPAPHCRTPILGYSLNVAPEKHFLNWQQDPYGNWVARLVFPEPTDRLEVVVDLIADLTVINPFDFFVEPYAEHVPVHLRADAGEGADPVPRDRARRAAARGVARRLPADDRRARTRSTCWCGSTSSCSTRSGTWCGWSPACRRRSRRWSAACGSCRDTGWLLVQILRQLGIAARFASGYLIQLVADVKPLDGPAGTERDFTDLHAWAEVYIPGAGWIGLDPTSGLLAGEGHIPLACTADPGSAAPVIGFTDVCEVEFDFAMSVTRVHEDPRVTHPYTDAQWAAIDALGEEVDAALAAHDVRLTQGGEPTFVSIDDMDGPEWNYTALSPKKRELALGLLRPAAPALRAAGAAARRAGQVVSGRAAAALGARHLLARRRRAAVARPGADRRHHVAGHRRRGDGGRASPPRSRRGSACPPDT